MIRRMRGVMLETTDIEGRLTLRCTQRGSRYLDQQFTIRTATDITAVLLAPVNTEVTFRFTVRKDRAGRFITQAGEVGLLKPPLRPTATERLKCDFCPSLAEMIIEVGYNNCDAAEYTRVCLDHVNQAFLVFVPTGRRSRIVQYLDIGIGHLVGWRPWEEPSQLWAKFN